MLVLVKDAAAVGITGILIDLVDVAFEALPELVVLLLRGESALVHHLAGHVKILLRLLDPVLYDIPHWE